MSNTWIEPIYDRSQADVDRLLELISKGSYSALSEAEKAEYDKDSKGAINLSDLERIKNNAELLAEVYELELTFSDIPKMPTVSWYKELTDNIKVIRDASLHHKSIPNVPDHPLNTFDRWNDIEYILRDIYEILMHNFRYYCGTEISTGDSFGALL